MVGCSCNIFASRDLSQSSVTIRRSLQKSAVVKQVECTSSARAGFEVFLSSDAAILLTDAMFLYLSILETNGVV
jgi:hypothetical protein